VVRRYGHFDTAEDAVQEAMLAAATQWPSEGLPDSPKGWLITVAARRLTDLLAVSKLAAAVRSPSSVGNLLSSKLTPLRQQVTPTTR
jgi:predicted RNA polymerase sigma factor